MCVIEIKIWLSKITPQGDKSENTGVLLIQNTQSIFYFFLT